MNPGRAPAPGLGHRLRGRGHRRASRPPKGSGGSVLRRLAVLGYALAFYFLARSLKYIPLGVAYAIWSGLGTVGSVLLGLLIWKEVLGPIHILGIALIVVGVVVLNVAPSS